MTEPAVPDLTRYFGKDVHLDAHMLLAINKRTPTWVATLSLLAQAILLIADKSFGDDCGAVALALVLILMFWPANELLLHDSPLRRFLGKCVWAFAVVVVPIVLVLRNKGDVAVVWARIQGLQFTTQCIILVGVTSLGLAPVALNK
jgi:hypothetical protein